MNGALALLRWAGQRQSFQIVTFLFVALLAAVTLVNL